MPAFGEAKATSIAAAATVATAVGLAALYVVGAYLKITELLGADIRVQDALPLVPIEQLLARGIATVGISLIIGATIGSSIVVIALTFPSPDRPMTERRLALLVPAFLVLFSVALGVTLSFRADLIAATAVATIVVSLAMWFRQSSARALALAFASALLALAAYAWFFPIPLPAVSIKTTDGEEHLGTLVVIADGTWYVHQGGGRIRTFYPSQLEYAYVRTRERARTRVGTGSTVTVTGSTVTVTGSTVYTTTTVPATGTE